jgi:protein phosphatase
VPRPRQRRRQQPARHRRRLRPLYTIARKRLARRLLTVVDATNVQTDARRPILAVAREYHAIPVAIVLDVSTKLCLERTRTRTDRSIGAHTVRQQCSLLRQSVRNLKREGFRYIYVLRSPDEIDAAPIERVRLWTDRRDDHGPFDIIGDIHGCFDELTALLERLGYTIATAEDLSFVVTHPATAASSSSATSSTAAPRSPRSSASSWTWSPAAPPCASPATTRSSSSRSSAAPPSS